MTMDQATTLFATLLLGAAVLAALAVRRMLVPSIETRVGRVISNGMDRVEAMRRFGADRFLTFMPMPDGSCWSVTVTRHDDEPTAKRYYAAVSESEDAQ